METKLLIAAAIGALDRQRPGTDLGAGAVWDLQSGRVEMSKYALLNPDPLVDREMLRAYARQQVETSPLIRRCAAGDRNAIRALHVGFWPFVLSFEKVIDERTRSLPVKLLIARYGRSKIRDFLGAVRHAVEEMRQDEGSHAELWRVDARRCGIHDLGWHQTTGVDSLIRETYEAIPSVLFCRLAGTEYIAEELSRFLTNSPYFLAAFSSRRWTWGEAHLAHHKGHSHLEIDEDIALATNQSASTSEARRSLEAAIKRCQKQFFAASVDVHHSLLEEALPRAA